MDKRQGASRIGSIGAMAGAVLLSIGTYLHPMNADPNDARSAFAEYAADHLWIASHLTQFLGAMLMVGALVLLSRRMADGPTGDWAHLGTAAAVGTLVLTSVLQAVDGVALKMMVDAWAAAPEHEQALRFHSAVAVRQIEIGLASYASIMFGTTATVYGIALVIDHAFPRWLGLLGICGGGSLFVAGLVMAHTGFSGLSMAMNMPSSLLLLIWIIGLGAIIWPQNHS
jgi:uncharacterized protein DUF4386